MTVAGSVMDEGFGTTTPADLSQRKAANGGAAVTDGAQSGIQACRRLCVAAYDRVHLQHAVNVHALIARVSTVYVQSSDGGS